MKQNIIIGGAWPYANSSLHLGHIAGLISGDVLARYYRLKGDNVLYVSGSDTHGTPITERARKEGIEPKEIAQKYHEEFTEMFNKLNFSYDLYSKTYDPYHEEKVKELFLKLYRNGYIYEKIEEQAYCQKCEKFLQDRDIKLICPECGEETKGDQCDNCLHVPTTEELLEGKCIVCGSKLIKRNNKVLYLKLSAFQKEIEEDLCDLDTEYREALAKGLVDMKYLSDTPLSLKYGTDMQQQELKRVYSKPLSGKQLKDIINYISKDMQGDYQYGRYKGIASMYLNIADKNKGREAR